jgi:hypothetical protein
MPSDLITSTIKSELGIPAAGAVTFGVPLSAAATAAVGRNAEGRRMSVLRSDDALVAASARSGTLAAPASVKPVRNLRRFSRVRAARAMFASRRMLQSNDFWIRQAVMLVQRQGSRQARNVV